MHSFGSEDRICRLVLREGFTSFPNDKFSTPPNWQFADDIFKFDNGNIFNIHVFPDFTSTRLGLWSLLAKDTKNQITSVGLENGGFQVLRATLYHWAKQNETISE